MARRIYTKRGDRGRTDHPGGQRVAKDHPDLQLLGALDELNALIGTARALAADLDADPSEEVRATLKTVQRELFLFAPALFMPEASAASAAAESAAPVARLAAGVGRLEERIDALDAPLPPLTGFILPGGHPAAACLHVARTVCRRAECLLTAELDRPGRAALPWQAAATYLNRLGDLLFVAARSLNGAAGRGDETLPPS